MTGHPSTSRAEQLANFRAGLLNFFLTGVGVDIQRCGDIGMAADALDRLEVDVRLRQGRDVAVPEDMRRCAKEVDLAADALVQPAEHHVGQGRLPSQDKARSVDGLQEDFQPFIQRNDALAAGSLGRGDFRLVVRVGDAALDVDQLLLEVDVLPLEAQHFACR